MCRTCGLFVLAALLGIVASVGLDVPWSVLSRDDKRTPLTQIRASRGILSHAWRIPYSDICTPFACFLQFSSIYLFTPPKILFLPCLTTLSILDAVTIEVSLQKHKMCWPSNTTTILTPPPTVRPTPAPVKRENTCIFISMFWKIRRTVEALVRDLDFVFKARKCTTHRRRPTQGPPLGDRQPS